MTEHCIACGMPMERHVAMPVCDLEKSVAFQGRAIYEDSFRST